MVGAPVNNDTKISRLGETPVLGFDTSGTQGIVGVAIGGRLILRYEDMARQQAERLMPLIEAVLLEAGICYRDLVRIGVGVGPGSFAGIRVGVSAARGLALSLGIPAVGISGFDVLSHVRPDADFGTVAAPRSQLYLAALRDCVERQSPTLATPQKVAQCPGPVTRLEDLSPEEHLQALLHLAVERDEISPPKPLYIKPADATPQKSAPRIVP